MERLRLSEVFGLSPWRERLAETLMMLRGDDSTPPSRFDLTSIEQLTRLPGWRIWAGQRVYGRRVPISNLYNHHQPPPEEGWSVRVTDVRDFRGGRLTYDSHNGTDFAVPVGTQVVPAAPGRVLRISSEFNRGGLKIFIDHGAGLVTSYNHLARALARVGDSVCRGETIALSGYSGIDGFATFPFGIPHVHFNVWLNTAYVDPFGYDNELSLFLGGNEPTPFRSSSSARAEKVPATDWDMNAVQDAIDSCISEASKAELRAIQNPEERAMGVHMHMSYYPTRFPVRTSLYQTSHPRAPHLDLPFRAIDFDSIVFPDE